MNTSVVVDASIWVSWLWSFDTNHDASNTWMEQCIANDDFFIVPSLLLIEVAASISRQTGQTLRAKEAITRLSSISKLLPWIPL